MDMKIFIFKIEKQMKHILSRQYEFNYTIVSINT